MERLVQPLVAIRITAAARQPLPRYVPRQVKQQRQVRGDRRERDQVADEGQGRRLPHAEPEPLIRQGRVEEPIADHQSPFGKRRSDRALDVIESGREMYQDFGSQTEPMITFEQQRTESLSAPGATGLPGVQQRVVPRQPFGKQARLGGLACSLAAFKRHEQPAHEPPTKWSSTATARAGRLLRSTAAAATSGTWMSATDAPEMVIWPTCWPRRTGAGIGAW